MAADKTIATQVIKFGSHCMLTSTLYDLKKAATQIAATVRGKCGEEELVSSLDKVVDKLSGKKDEVAQGGGGVFSKLEEKKVEKLSSRAGEVKQPGSNLVWLRCPLGQGWNGSSCQGKMQSMPWAQAMKACPVGYRLPTRQEFLNLLGGCDEKVQGGRIGKCASCEKSAKCSSMFGKDEGWYWSSSEHEYVSSSAWLVGFTGGDVVNAEKDDNGYVRCVVTAGVTANPTIPRGFVRIEPGTFTMGSPPGGAGRNDNEEQHRVTITRPFLVQATEVTQGQYRALMGNNPSKFSSCGDDFKGLSCKGYRLPTEAEWEYAARAGSTGARHGNLDAIAWYRSNSGRKTHPVGKKLPNAWGLYDMLGNVYEWTNDWYGNYSGSSRDPTGPSGGSKRVVRGGGWLFNARFCRSASRVRVEPVRRGVVLGFRLARSLFP